MPLHIEKDSRGIVAVWLDNAARRNAMDDSMLGALADLLAHGAQGAGVRAVLIRGMNECFCSGRDLGELGAGQGSTPASRLVPINQLARAFRACPVPVLSFVQGKAAGLGVSLVCWSDIALAADDATFSIPEARAGIAPSVTAVSLMEVVGRRRAMDLCLTGRTIDAVTARDLGLLHQTCPPADAEKALESVLSSMLKGAPLALRLTKDLGRQAEGMAFEPALAVANVVAEQSMSSEELAEGLTALREKRPPAWLQEQSAVSITPPFHKASHP